MRHPEHSTEMASDPDGSIFLPKDRLIKEFLSLEGDPYDILEALRIVGGIHMVQVYGALQFSLLQSRGGVEKLSEDIGDETEAQEVNKRMHFYKAVNCAIGQLALGQAA